VVLPLFLLSTPPLALVQNASETKSLLENSPGAEKRLVPSSAQVKASPELSVTIAPGSDDYPGVRIAAPAGSWDLSPYGHVEARVTNTGTKPLYLALRVDGAGDWRDNPWNAEADTIQPGETKTLKTIFGYSYGYKPGYKLKPNSVVGVLLFASKSPEPQSFRIDSLVAAGPAGETPPVAPDDVRVRPKDGVLFDAMRGATPNNGLLVDNSPLDSHSMLVKPAVGRWSLVDYTDVQVDVKNSGSKPASARVRLETNGGGGL